MKYLDKISEEDRKKMKKLYAAFKKSYGGSIKDYTRKIEVQPGYVGTINWACMWNKPADIGKKVLVLCCNKRFSVVEIIGNEVGNNTNVYRNEDIVSP